MTDTIAMIGVYKFKSPYHRKLKYLPFTVLGIDRELQSAQCETVEYKGWTKRWVTDWWNCNDVLKMIEKGFLIRVKKSYPLP